MKIVVLSGRDGTEFFLLSKGSYVRNKISGFYINEEIFVRYMGKDKEIAKEGYTMTFGVRPTKLETG